jgi:hypothetical protein
MATRKRMSGPSPPERTSGSAVGTPRPRQLTAW